jgi:hypothetical protein
VARLVARPVTRAVERPRARSRTEVVIVVVVPGEQKLGLVLVALERDVVDRVDLGRRDDRARTERTPVAATMLASPTKTILIILSMSRPSGEVVVGMLEALPATIGRT